MKDLLDYINESLFKNNNKIPSEYFDFCIELINLGLYDKSTGAEPGIKKNLHYKAFKITKPQLKQELEVLLNKFEDAKFEKQKNIKLTTGESVLFGTWLAKLKYCWAKHCPEEDTMKDILRNCISPSAPGDSWFDDDSEYRLSKHLSDGWPLLSKDIENLKRNAPELYKKYINEEL